MKRKIIWKMHITIIWHVPKKTVNSQICKAIRSTDTTFEVNWMASYVNPGITLDINEFEPPGMATIFFSDIQSDTLNYHTPRLMVPT